MLPSPDSNTTAIVSAIGYETKKVTLQKDKEPVVAMNKSSGALQEVVVTGYGEKKKLKDTTSATQELKEKSFGCWRLSQPITLSKNEKFDQYLNENIKPVYR